MKNKSGLIVMVCIVGILALSGCSGIKTSSKVKEVNAKYKSGSDLTFFITNDIHYLSKDLTDKGEAFQKFVDSGDGKQLGYIDEITDAFVEEVIEKRPQVLILNGDLTTNGEKKSHEDLAGKLEKVKEKGILVYVVPGNHDINNPWAREFKENQQLKTDYISPKDFTRIYGSFGYNDAISREENSLSYLAAPSENLWLLMLDTAQYKYNEMIGEPETDGEISEDTFKWIKKCSELAKSNGAQLIAVMHHSLIDHSPVVKKGFTLNNSEEAVRIFSDCGVPLTLTAHIHVQDIASHKKTGITENKGEIYDIANSALSVYPQQYGILKYSPKEASLDYSTCKVDVNTWADKKGSKDEKLLNFSEYSMEAFGERAYNMAYSKLSMEDIYSEQQLKEMCKTVEMINLSYFAGTLKQDSDKIKATEGYKLFEASNDSFYKSYVTSLSQEKPLEGTKLHVSLQKIK